MLLQILWWTLAGWLGMAASIWFLFIGEIEDKKKKMLSRIFLLAYVCTVLLYGTSYWAWWEKTSFAIGVVFGLMAWGFWSLFLDS
ncbi:hypothetical protein A3A67_03265 [Candidatus Peribacteria bacterium RIFCSPLOWO2_01_FULL_51_18]|nr:MAG: hypothetical protein A3C52_01020 [Candidatus Peribacteria bacterium RIFCSPHIGHO2_02_FULL_51_15]OGJ66453.1 MAG: hypothetical protein A3A67_03265 [Candidatus Peribacteria bacterium RIFCSPLOWO2_01_FULL_51_18]OGJ68202.1 MAG: hypothetical protein A3J34_00605 [Candidatus Peribacteria bacterium RIFCSPLOWO2_02_FULL_51_10]